MLWLTRVRSHSMEPTLPDGSLALTRRLWRRTSIRRGAVVVVDAPALGGLVVKRVIGLPGETVAIQSGQVSVDGRALAEPYAAPSVFTQTFRVPARHYFLMGDNRDASSDSRTWPHPYVGRDAILGKIVGTARPWAWQSTRGRQSWGR